MNSITIDLLSGTICSSVPFYFGWLRVGLSEMQPTPAFSNPILNVVSAMSKINPFPLTAIV